MEKKIAPSEQKAQALRALLQGEAEGQSGDELLSLLVRLSTERILQEALRVARSPAPHYPRPPRPGSLAPNIGDHGPSDSALAAARGWRLRRPAADQHAARCASRDLCSGARPSARCALVSAASTRYVWV